MPVASRRAFTKTFKKFGAHNLKGLLKGLIQKTASSTLCLQVARLDCMNGRPAKRFEPEVQLHQSYDFLGMDRLVRVCSPSQSQCCSPSQSQCWCVRCLGNGSSVWAARASFQWLQWIQTSNKWRDYIFVMSGKRLRFIWTFCLFWVADHCIMLFVR